MKQILIALLLAFTTSTVINAQKQSSIEKDSTENVKVTLSKKTDTKADESNTTVTVIGVDTTAGKDANSVSSSGSSHIKNTFTGIGLFIFLWAITGEFGIGAIGLLIMFMGIGQWIIGSKQQKTDDIDPFRMNVSRKRDIDTRNNSAAGNNFGTRNDPPTGNNFDAAAPSATQQEERNGEKSDENK